MISTTEDVQAFREKYGLPQSVSDEEIKKGCEEESSEHSEFPEEVVYQLVADHLKIDPNYYAKEEGDEEGGVESMPTEGGEEGETAPQNVKQMTHNSDHAEEARKYLRGKMKKGVSENAY